MEKTIEQTLLQIQSGDDLERERFIWQYRPFIIRSVSRVCKRHISWNDDEASIGLIAFNEAINRYQPVHGKSFDNFAYLIIRNRLIDEFRKNGKLPRVESLTNHYEDEFDLTPNEIAGSIIVYERDESAAKLAEELIVYDETLQQYGICLEELEECSPDHRDTRFQLIRIAKQFCESNELLDHLFARKQLPIKGMLKYASVSRKTLERNRKYLIALILIYSSEEFIRIRGAVSFAGVGE